MKRIGLLAWVAILGLATTVLFLSWFSAVQAQAEIDLLVEARAPNHVDVGAAYVVNLSYANKGTAAAPDNWVSATLPPGTQFVEATCIDGTPRPPDVIDGQVLTWTLAPLGADSTWGHILISLQTDETLPEGTNFVFSAQIATSAWEPDTTNNTASVTTTTSCMGGSAKQVQARHARPGDVLTYTLTINLAPHAGGNNTRWVTLTDTLPFSHQVRFLGWSSEVTGTVVEGHMLRWQGQVRAGEPVVLQYQVGVEGAVPPGTVITNAAALHWAGQQMPMNPVTTAITLPHGVLGLGPHQGGELHHRYGVTLTVPPGAVTDTTQFRIGPLFTDTIPGPPPGGLLFANRAFEIAAFRFGEPVRSFSTPLTITVSCTNTCVPDRDRDTLRLWTRDGPGEPWTLLGAPVQVAPGALAFTTTHFSQFALFYEADQRTYLPLVTR